MNISIASFDTEVKKNIVIVKEKPFYKKPGQLAVVVSVLAVTFICFSPALTNKKHFTNWDDTAYVLNEPLIHKLSAENIKALFNPSNAVMGNYHPVTMFSLAINYHFSNIKARPYALTNILIHILNTLLVFIFLYTLTEKKFVAGAIGALWFGIHPMHVESVAWISERKDVLYAFFFLASCIVYLRYTQTQKYIHLLAAFALFVLSCLSKAMAAPLPLVLLLIDYFINRKFTLKSIAEKIPFLIVALLIGYNAIEIQLHGALASPDALPPSERMKFASYGFIMYLWKLLVPLNLSAFYPYPAVGVGEELPRFFLLAPELALFIIAVPFALLRVLTNADTLRAYVFGMGFFVLTILFVLQFIPVGIAVMADRYTYLPYVGVFFILALFVHKGILRQRWRAFTIVAACLFSVLLMVKCYARVSVWNTSETLWTDVIEKYPFDSAKKNTLKISQEGYATAYKNRANYYHEMGIMTEALADYSTVVLANPRDAGAFVTMGNIYALQRQFNKTIEMHTRAIEADLSHYDAYWNRGLTYSLLRSHEKALDDYSKALSLMPGSVPVQERIAFELIQLGRFEECIAVCNNIISIDAGSVNAYYYRGIALNNLGKADEALNDLQHVVSANQQHREAWFNISVLLYQKNNFKEAYMAAQAALSLGYPVSQEFIAELSARAK
jgi:protein O-mannosyl-transferase